MKGLLMSVAVAGAVMAADPLRPTPSGISWVFDGGTSVQVRVLKPSLPEGRITWNRAGNAWSSEWRSGNTGFSGEVFRIGAFDLWVLRLQANKPGELGFRTAVVSKTDPARLLGRRLLTSKVAGEPLFTWVFPMESDVERDGGAILLRGEGEALVIVARGNTALAKVRQAGVEGDQTDDVGALLAALEASRVGGAGPSRKLPPAVEPDAEKSDDIEVLPLGDEIDLVPEGD